jgi:hypothetical protein
MSLPKVSFKVVKFTALAIFILLQFYLIFLKRHYALDLDIAPNNQPSPNIYADRSVGQTFFAKRNNLARIDVTLGTHKRINTRDVTFMLREQSPERKEIRSKVFNASSVKDNLYFPFEFKPIKKSKGKKYYFLFYSPESTQDNSICVWTNTQNIYRNGQYLINHRPAGGDLIFRIYSKRPIFTELGRIVRNYKGLFGKVWFLVVAIVSFEIIQIVVFLKLLDFIRNTLKNT